MTSRVLIWLQWFLWFPNACAQHIAGLSIVMLWRCQSVFLKINTKPNRWSCLGVGICCVTSGTYKKNNIRCHQQNMSIVLEALCAQWLVVLDFFHVCHSASLGFSLVCFGIILWIFSWVMMRWWTSSQLSEKGLIAVVFVVWLGDCTRKEDKRFGHLAINKSNGKLCVFVVRPIRKCDMFIVIRKYQSSKNYNILCGVKFATHATQIISGIKQRAA